MVSNPLEKDTAVQVELADIEATSKLQPPKTTGDVHLIDENGQVRRIPIPSLDPNDPLNFSKWRKLGIIVCCCWFSVFSLVLVGGIGPIIPVFLELYGKGGKSVSEVINLTTYPSLVMACGAFLILPLSMMFGRRPVFLGCTLLLLGCTIGAAVSTTFQTHMAMRIMQGFATGATESVLPLIITDISFLDERGLWFGVYWGTQNLINAVFTISVSYLVADAGWRWFYWTFVILCGFGMILAFFFLPETRYERSPMSMNGQVVHTDEFGVTQILSDTEASARNLTTNPNSGQVIPSQATYLHHLRPYQGAAPNSLHLGLSALSKMFQSLTSPAVLWSILATSISLGSGIAISLTYATVLQSPPYNWSPASTGLVNIGIFPASLLAMFYAGYIGDKINLWLARRRNGVHIPEDTLVILIFPTIVSAIGLVVYAVTAKYPQNHSFWGVIMGWTLYEFGFIVLLISSTHFAAEAFPQNPGPALVMVVGMKNIVSFGASYGITPMVQKFSYLTAYMILWGIFVGIFLLGVPVYVLNPRWREYIAKKQEEKGRGRD